MNGNNKDNCANNWTKSVLGICISILTMSMMTACATPSAKLPPPPPKYVDHADERIAHTSSNSLWTDGASLFEDTKARRLNDLVTIQIVEKLSGSGKADTDTSRESEILYELTNFLGMNNDFGIQDWPIINGLYKSGNVFEPEIASKTKSDFKGKGDTNREGNLVATITAKVVEVMPNGNLVLESRKEITINNEKQILVLTGIVRGEDISAENAVFSNRIADAQVYYVGDGVIQDKQSPGWMVRALDRVWPF